ncbi:MAG TPA: hypothetical protein VGI45_09060 [Terracidiphilus sp.]|jgi:hypothetical protein
MLRKLLFLATLCIAGLGIANAQTSVSASSITDSFERPFSGKLCFAPVDATGAATGFRVGSVQVISTPVCGLVSNGVLQTGLSVQPTPTGIYYHITVANRTTGAVIRDYGMTQVTGSSWTLDSYDPSMAVLPVTALSTGTTTMLPPGSGASCTVSGSGPALLNCSIPQGATGATGPTGPAGGITNVNGAVGAFAVNGPGASCSTVSGTYTCAVGYSGVTADGSNGIKVGGAVASKQISNTFYVDQYATGGSGTSGSEWTSASGCGGIYEAWQQLPSSGGVLYMRQGYYQVTNSCASHPLQGKSFTLKADGRDKVFVDESTVTAGTVALLIEGSITSGGSSTTTSGAISQGSTTFGVASATGIAQGTWLQILSTTQIWNNNDATFYKGEFQRVLSISGTTITPEVPLWDSYNSSTPVNILSPVVVDISGFTMLGNSGASNAMGCLWLAYTADSSIHDTSTQNCNERGWNVAQSVNVKFFNNTGREYYPTSPIGTNYGVAFSFVYNAEAYGNSIVAGRHAITFGSGAAGGVNRILDVHDNPELTAGANTVWALDTHGDSEHYKFHDNPKVAGGIGVAGQWGEVYNNKIMFSQSANNYLICFTDMKTWNMNIHDNTLLVNKAISGGNGMITNSAFPSSDGGGVLKLSNTRIEVPNGVVPTTAPMDFVFNQAEPAAIDEIDIDGSWLVNNNPASTTSTTLYNWVINTSTTAITKLVLRDNNIRRGSMFVTVSGTGSIGRILLDHNTITQAPQYGLRISIANGTTPLTIKDNDISLSNQNGLYLATNGGAIQQSGNRFYDNGQDATQTASQRVGEFASGVAMTINSLNDSFTDDQGSPTQQYGQYLNTGSGVTMTRSNPTFAGNVTAIDFLVSGSVVYDGATNRTGNTVSSGTAAWTAGTQLAGDIRWNTAPTSTGPAGWICVTGGTPCASVAQMPSLGQAVSSFTASWTPSAVTASTCAEQTETVTGVVTGKVLSVTPPASPGAHVWISGTRASASNTAAVAFCADATGGTPPSGTWLFRQ